MKSECTLGIFRTKIKSLKIIISYNLFLQFFWIGHFFYRMAEYKLHWFLLRIFFFQSDNLALCNLWKHNLQYKLISYQQHFNNFKCEINVNKKLYLMVQKCLYSQALYKYLYSQNIKMKTNTPMFFSIGKNYSYKYFFVIWILQFQS